MSDTTKRRLIYLGLAIIIFLLVFYWRRPTALKDAVAQVTGGNFQWPGAATANPINYSPSTFTLPNFGYVSNDPQFGCGCGMCSKAPNSNSILPASPQAQFQALGGSLPVGQVQQNISTAYSSAGNIRAFGGGGSSMVVGWS